MGLAFLLRPLAFGDIDHGAHAFDEIAGRVENGVAYFVDIPDRAVRKNDLRKSNSLFAPSRSGLSSSSLALARSSG